MTAAFDVFIPDGDEARRWAEDELSNPRYADARPTWFDLFVRDVWHALVDLFSPQGGGDLGPVALVLLTVVIVAALIAGLIVWGRPRASRSIRPDRDLLGSRDDRSATQLRADAERSARAGHWDDATVLRFRALARALLERDLIDPPPGATAQAISREAASVFRADADALHEAASVFDDVRYLGHASDADRYRALVALDDRLAAQHPEVVPT